MKRPKRYTQAERAEAIALAGEVGAAEAGRRLGISAETIRTWVRRAQEAATAAVRTVEAYEATEPATTDGADEPSTALEAIPASVGAMLAQRGKPWRERASTMAAALDDVAGLALAATARAIVADRGRDARELATATGILLDKAALVGGRPQRITESHSTSQSVHLEHRRVTVETDPALAAKVRAVKAELGMPDEPDDVIDVEEGDTDDAR